MNLVSVIVVIWEGNRYLRDALDSIFAQTYSPIEVIVVDDGSREETAAIVQAYPHLTYIRQEGVNKTILRRKGLERASGEWVAFLNPDDLWIPNKIHLQVEALCKRPDCHYVIGKMRYLLVDVDGYAFSTLMARRALFTQIPPNIAYEYEADTDWFTRVKEVGVPGVILSQVVAHVRVHAGNSAPPISKIGHELLRIARGSLQRKKQSTLLVSVIIPVYNGELYLKEALDSVFSQTYRPIEVIVIDDGSTDKTRDIALQYADKITYIYQQNGGVASARNRGIEASHGEYLSLLDADDLWIETKLQEQMDQFQQNPELDFSLGKIVHFFSPHISAEMRSRFQEPQSYAPLTFLAKRESFYQVGLFNTSYGNLGELIEWWVRAKKIGAHVGFLDRPLLHRRIHGENLTWKQKELHRQYLRLLRNSLQERGAQ